MTGPFVRKIEERLTVSARRDDFARAWDLAVNSIVSGYESGTPLSDLATGEVFEPEGDERRIGSWVLEPEPQDHSPVDWFTPGRWPSCSCGFNPRDNLKLTAHWAEHGTRWMDDHGRLVAQKIDAQKIDAPTPTPALDYADEIAARVYEANVGMIDPAATEGTRLLMAVAAREGYALGFGAAQ